MPDPLSRSLAYYHLREFDLAILDLESAIEMNPPLRLHIWLGDIYSTIGDYNRA